MRQAFLFHSAALHCTANPDTFRRRGESATPRSALKLRTPFKEGKGDTGRAAQEIFFGKKQQKKIAKVEAPAALGALKGCQGQASGLPRFFIRADDFYGHKKSRQNLDIPYRSIKS